MRLYCAVKTSDPDITSHYEAGTITPDIPRRRKFMSHGLVQPLFIGSRRRLSGMSGPAEVQQGPEPSGRRPYCHTDARRRHNERHTLLNSYPEDKSRHLLKRVHSTDAPPVNYGEPQDEEGSFDNL